MCPQKKRKRKKEGKNWVVVEAQWAEWSLPKPEVHRLNPVIGRRFSLIHCFEIKENGSQNVPFYCVK